MSAPDLWTQVDQYIAELFRLSDDALDTTIRRSHEHGLPDIQVSHPQGQLLHLMARAIAARRILEIGTLGGFSTIFLARALPENGVLYSLELDPTHAAVACENISQAGLADTVRLLEGDAQKTLATMIADRWDPFDFVFVDADKPGYPSYLTAVLQLSRPGTVIVADNVVRKGMVVDADSEDPTVRGVRKFNDMLALSPRLQGTIIQTVGTKGHDGFAIAVVTA